MVTDCSATALRLRLAEHLDVPDAGFASGRQYRHRIADGQLAGLDAAHEAAIVVQFRVGRILRAADVLHREAEFLGVCAVDRRRGLEDLEQRRPVVPVEMLATVNDHVAVERRHRDETHVAKPSSAAKAR
jgi:hypothetical protein